MYSSHHNSSVPISPKRNIYQTDGTGRDTYISCNSGGLVHEVKKVSLPNISKPSLSPKRQSNLRLDGKIIHYNPDGTGRDNYIAANQGGFCKGKYAMNHGFIDSLRQYEKIRTSLDGQRDFFDWAQKHPSKSQLALDKTRIIQVRDVVERLALPKLTNTTTNNNHDGCNTSPSPQIKQTKKFFTQVEKTEGNSPNSSDPNYKLQNLLAIIDAKIKTQPNEQTNEGKLKSVMSEAKLHSNEAKAQKSQYINCFDFIKKDSFNKKGA